MLHFAYFLEEFRGIPPREPPISGTRVTTNWAGERPTRHCQVRICTPFPAVSLFVLLSFLLPVRALLCGRLPHTTTQQERAQPERASGRTWQWGGCSLACAARRAALYHPNQLCRDVRPPLARHPPSRARRGDPPPPSHFRFRVLACVRLVCAACMRGAACAAARRAASACCARACLCRFACA